MTSDRLRTSPRRSDLHHTIELAARRLDAVMPRSGRSPTVREEIAGRAWDGKRVLDIGCRDVFLAFEGGTAGCCRDRRDRQSIHAGVPQLLSKSSNPRYSFQTQKSLRSRPRTCTACSDVAILAGVPVSPPPNLYHTCHLRYPMVGVLSRQSGRRVRKHDVLRARRVLLIETAILSTTTGHPLLYCPTGGQSP